MSGHAGQGRAFVRDVGTRVAGLFALAAMSAMPARLDAQVSYATAGSIYAQNFNAGLPASSNNSATWSNNTTYPGWYVYRVATADAPATYRLNSSSSSGAVQVFRVSSSSTDGALGSRPSDTTGDVLYGLRLTNNTGATLTGFTVGVSVEHWHRSGVTTNNQIKVAYQLGSPANLAAGAWTDLPRLTLDSVDLGGSSADQDGSDHGNRRFMSPITVRGISWAPGSDIWIRFYDDNTTGNDQGLAIDDVTFSAFAAGTYTAGTTYWGVRNLVEYRAGNIPVILTNPHGGYDEYDDIPNRKKGSLERDTRTQELTDAIADEIFARTGKRPHTIFSHLYRREMDPNRPLDNNDDEDDQALDAGSNGHPDAVLAWRQFHQFVNYAQARVTETAPHFGFLTDVHGQSHEPERIEVGFNLSKDDLQKSDATLEHPAYGEKQTHRTLAQDLGGSFADLIRGPRSLGGLLELRGFDSVPSPDIPHPEDDEEYFNGGYTSECHGSLYDQGNVDSYQLECNPTGIRDSDANAVAFAKVYVGVLNDYLFDRYGYELGAAPIYRLTASTDRIYEGGNTPTAITLTVTRTGYVAPGSPGVTLALAFSGTAINGTDYTASSGTVTFSTTDTSRTITLTRVSDALDEGAESIVVALAPTASQTADTTPLTIALSDDERTSAHVVAVDPVMTEGGAAATVKVTRDRVFNSQLQPQFLFSGTAVRDVDYTVVGLNSTDRATILENQADATFQLAAVGDATLDPEKTIVVTVANGTVYRPGVPAAATVRLAEQASDRPAGLQYWLPGTNAAGAVRDESGNERHSAIHPATAGQGPAFATGHAAGTTAVFFDGANDALVTPKFDFTSGGAFSVAFRFRIDSTTTNRQRILFSVGPKGAVHSLNIVHVEGSDILRTLLKEGSPTAAPSDTALDLTGIENDGATAWRHYALTASTAGGVKVYLDGVLTKSVGSWLGRFQPSEPLWIGWGSEPPATSPSNFKGPMQDVRIYSRELSASEVSALAAP